MIRFSLIMLFPILLTAENISFNRPVQIPEAVLQPGKYAIQLEDHMADRAIVKITDPSGTDHFLLTVPSKTASKSVVFFPKTSALEGWRSLEFVYPKDEAVKLTADTGKPVLAYDPSYDKLPANLSAADRKVVTLWLLTPKPVGGLSAAKYSAPRTMAAVLPSVMPKTAGNAFFELIAGFLSFVAGMVAFLWRKVSGLPKTWKIVGVTGVAGMVTGFALPAASSYQTVRSYNPPAQTVLEVSSAKPNNEVEQLKERNRRLEALVKVLREKQ